MATILLLSLTAFSNGWKHDINFMNSSGTIFSHIYKGVIDERDHSYMLQQLQTSAGTSLNVHEYLPDGSSGFVKQVILPSAQTWGIPGHNGGGIAVDETHVYVVKEFHPTNPAATAFMEIYALDKTNPSSNWVSLGVIHGELYTTELAVKDGFLYLHGYAQKTANHSVEFSGNGNSILINSIPANTSHAIVAKFQLNGHTNNSATPIWAKRVFSSGHSGSGNLQLDAQNNIYLGGSASNGSQITGTSATINYSFGDQAATVIKMDQNGNVDLSFTPIVFSTLSAPSLMHTDRVDDLKVVSSENALYFTMKEHVRKHYLNNGSSNWATTIPNTHANRIAISGCSEMYVVGTKRISKQGAKYFAKTLNKYNGGTMSTLNSTTYNTTLGSDGEIILIQCDGDKVIAGDFKVSTPSFAIDYDQLNATNNPTFPNVTWTTNGGTGSWVGIYDDGIKGELVNDFILFGRGGREKYIFECGESILFDGTMCKNETNHFIDLWKQNSSGSYAYHGGFGWLGGQANIKDITLMAASKTPPLALPPGNYKIKLAIQNECVGWLEKLVEFTILPGQGTLDPSFNMANTPTHQNIFGNWVFGVNMSSVPNPPATEHKWDLLSVNGSSITLVQTTGWSAALSNHSFSNIPATSLYKIVHHVRDINGCAPEAQASKITGATKNGGTISMNKSTEIELYPNPATSYLMITNPAVQKGQIYLREANGKLIQTHHLTDAETHRLDLSELIDGVYLIQITYDSGETITRRFVKK